MLPVEIMLLAQLLIMWDRVSAILVTWQILIQKHDVVCASLGNCISTTTDISKVIHFKFFQLNALLTLTVQMVDHVRTRSV